MTIFRYLLCLTVTLMAFHATAVHADQSAKKAIVPAASQPTIIAPATVTEKIPESLCGKTKVKTVANGEKTEVEGIAIEALPAYNMTPE